MASALVQHERVVVVGFTGSSAVGAAIARLAPDKELVMELGGNGPVIVLDDADPERTIAAVGAAAFFNAGQSCAAAERIIASERVHDWLVEGLVGFAGDIRLGDPRDPGTTMGPVNNEGVAAKMDDHVADASGRGGTVAFGGRRRDDAPTRLYYEPTVLARVPDGASVTREETFGPIAPVSAFADDRALLAAANASTLGLSSAVFTRDLDRAFWFAERLQTGQVTVNDTSNYWELHLPFGGWAGKTSGRGRVGGRHIFEAMTQIRSVAFDVGRRPVVTGDAHAIVENLTTAEDERPIDIESIGEGIRRERLRRGPDARPARIAGQPDRQRPEPDRARRVRPLDQLAAADRPGVRRADVPVHDRQRPARDRRPPGPPDQAQLPRSRPRVRAGLGGHVGRVRGPVAGDRPGRLDRRRRRPGTPARNARSS